MNRKSWIFLSVCSVLIVASFAGILIMKKVEETIYNQIPEEISYLTSLGLQALESNDLQGIKTIATQRLKNNATLADDIEMVASFLKQYGTVQNQTIVGLTLHTNNGIETDKLLYELETQKGYLLYTAIVVKTDNGFRLDGLNISSMENSLSELNRFSFRNKTIGHFLFLLVWIALMGFTLLTASICFGSALKHRWRRSLFVLAGIGSLHLNWVTGAIWYTMLNIHIPLATWSMTGSYSPIAFEIGIPVGAALYWFKWRNEEVAQQPSLGSVEFQNNEMDISDTPAFGMQLEGFDYTRREGVYGIAFNEASEVAIIKIPYGYHLPGGGLEENETHIECLRREFIEEVGRGVQPVSYITSLIQYTVSFKHSRHYQLYGHFYIVNMLPDEFDKVEADHELEWHSYERALQLLSLEYQRKALELAFAAREVDIL